MPDDLDTKTPAEATAGQQHELQQDD